MQIPGGPNLTFFVVKEDGQYKILDTTDKPNAIGLEILTRIKGGDLKGAKVLLIGFAKTSTWVEATTRWAARCFRGSGPRAKRRMGAR